MALQTFVFSFGYGQQHPITREKLDNRFLEIAAPSHEEAREEMVRRFGNSWGFQYPDRQAAGCERFELRPVEGDAALGYMPGTTAAERACNLCSCAHRPVSRRHYGPEAPDCSCGCHHVPDLGGEVITTAGARTIEPCADCNKPGILCATTEGTTVRDSAIIEQLSVVSIAREIADAGCLILAASAHAEQQNVCASCEEARDAKESGK